MLQSPLPAAWKLEASGLVILRKACPNRRKIRAFLRASPRRTGRSENMEQTRHEGRSSLSTSIAVLYAPNTSAVPPGSRREKIVERARDGRTRASKRKVQGGAEGRFCARMRRPRACSALERLLWR